MTRSKPKQDERRKELAREIGIVTIGVLIALAIGEVADNLRWKVRVTASMAAVREDLGDARYTLLERQVLQPCVDERLGLIGDVLREARQTHQLPDVKGMAFLPFRKFEFATWEVAKSEGVTLHMSRADAVSLGHIYSGLESFPGAVRGPESAAWYRLGALENAPGPIDEALLAELTMAYEDAKVFAIMSKVIADEQYEALRNRGIPVLWGAHMPPKWRTRTGLRTAMIEWGACPKPSINGKPYAFSAAESPERPDR